MGFLVAAAYTRQASYDNQSLTAYTERSLRKCRETTAHTQFFMFTCLKGAAASHCAPLELYLSALPVDKIKCNSLFSRGAQWDLGDVCHIRHYKNKVWCFSLIVSNFLTFVRDTSNLISC